MAHLPTISLKEFTATVQTAVKNAIQQHPSFNIPAPEAPLLGYIIWGFPLPDTLVANITVAETEAFANTVAAGITGGAPVIAAARLEPPKGSAYVSGGHLIVGFPPVTSVQVRQ